MEIELTEQNIFLYAAKHYYNPKYIDAEEFEEDFKRFKDSGIGKPLLYLRKTMFMHFCKSLFDSKITISRSDAMNSHLKIPHIF